MNRQAIIADLHIHSIASQHAYSTISEIATQANNIGLSFIGITDHGPAMIDAPREYYFQNLRVLPKLFCGVTLLKGAELNILDENGQVDLKSHTIDTLDYAIASYHAGIIPYYYTKENYTKGWLAIMDNPKVKILGHIDNPRIPFDFEPVLLKAKEKNILLEVNNASYLHVRPGSFEVGLELFSLAKEIGNNVIVNSDAHVHLDVGQVDRASELLSKINFPSENIVNSSLSLFQEYFANA